MPCSVWHNRDSRAFTVLELLVVTLVLAIAATLVLPSLGQTAAAELRESGRLLAADIGYARSAAIAHGADPRLVAFQTTKNAYHVAPRSKPDVPVTRPDTNEAYRVVFGQGRARHLQSVSIQSTNLEQDRLAFDVYGSPTRSADAGDARITLGLRGYTLTLRVDHATGEVTLMGIE